jgi:hypothetical protein
MLLVALASVCMGVISVAPGLGILLAIASTPALIRTISAVRRREETGESTATSNKLLLFLGSLGVVVTAGVAAWVTFFGLCFVSCLAAIAVNSETIAVLGLVVAGTGGLVVGVFTLRKLWRARNL